MRCKRDDRQPFQSGAPVKLKYNKLQKCINESKRLGTCALWIWGVWTSVFSERELTFTFAMSSPVRLSSVCLSSVTFVRATQAIEIFGNVSTPFGTLAIPDLSVKIIRDRPQGNPSVRGVKHVANAISRNRCKIGAKLVTLIGNCI